MSITLDAIIEDAADSTARTVELSPKSTSVLLYAVYLLSERENWLDLAENPLDEITDADWDAIEKIVANASYEIMTEVETMPVGATMIWHEQIPPDRWLVCDGGAAFTADYPDLFALWGYKYGGSGAQFGLPDMRNYSPMGVGGNVLLDATAGTVSETLTVNQIPSHKHDQFIGPTTPAYAGTGGAGRIAYGVLGTASLVPIQTANNGGGLSHNNLSPVFGVNFIVYGGKA